MAPPVRTSRQLWIDTGLDLLATEGPGAVRVEVLAQRIGVTRGGFYRQFGGRAELVDAMLDAWGSAAPMTCAAASKPRVAMRPARRARPGY